MEGCTKCFKHRHRLNFLDCYGTCAVALGSSSTDYVKVTGDKSPYEGNLVYWSIRMGRHTEMPTSKAFKLKKQKASATGLDYIFVKETFQKKTISLLPPLVVKINGYKNLQLLHGHCHNAKTALDLIDIRNKQSSIFFEKLSEEWSKVKYLWVDDVPIIFSC